MAHSGPREVLALGRRYHDVTTGIINRMKKNSEGRRNKSGIRICKKGRWTT